MELLNPLLTLYRNNRVLVEMELRRIHQECGSDPHGIAAAQLLLDLGSLDKGCGVEHPLLFENFADVLTSPGETRKAKKAFLATHFYPVLTSFGRLANVKAGAGLLMKEQMSFPALCEILRLNWFQNLEMSRHFAVCSLSDKLYGRLKRLRLPLHLSGTPELRFGWSAREPRKLALTIEASDNRLHSSLTAAPVSRSAILETAGPEASLCEGLVALDQFSDSLYEAFRVELFGADDVEGVAAAATEGSVLKDVLDVFSELPAAHVEVLRRHWATHPSIVTSAFGLFVSAR